MKGYHLLTLTYFTTPYPHAEVWAGISPH
eukprot:COSAG04_NODE_28422_length_275_cov_11.659091_1_plen_28_part_01